MDMKINSRQDSKITIMTDNIDDTITFLPIVCNFDVCLICFVVFPLLGCSCVGFLLLWVVEFFENFHWLYR